MTSALPPEMAAEVKKAIEESRESWNMFIVRLGYTNEQGKIFSDAYVTALAALTDVDRVINSMIAPDKKLIEDALAKAGIDEDEAIARAEAQMGR